MSDSEITRRRWEQIDALLQLVLDQPPEKRKAYLIHSCADDEELRREVESLLAHHAQAEKFLEVSPADVAAAVLTEHVPRLEHGQSLGRYKALTLLGIGGMGEVYLAEDTSLGRRVALKLLPERFTEDYDRVKRFEQEARAASALNHPNIVTIHEIGRFDKSQFIVSEFVDGQTLRKRLSGGAIPIREALDIAIQLSGALIAAHAAGIVHRDIKPENIMLRPDGLVKVLDFGLAKLVESPASPPSGDINTETGMVMGTSRYMSPEQARGQKVDSRTDIFTLGVVIYEMVAGRPPFDGSSTSDVLAAILKDEPPPLRRYIPNLPTEIEWIERKALAKECDERYQTARELHIDLKRLKQEMELKPKLEGLAFPISVDEAINARNKAVTTEKISLRRFAWLRRAAMAAIVATAVYVGMKWQPVIRIGDPLTSGVGNHTGSRLTKNGDLVFYSALLNGEPLQTYKKTTNGGAESTAFGPSGAGIQSISKDGEEVALLLNCELNWGECHEGTLAKMRLNGDGNADPQIVKENVWEADFGPDGDFAVIINDLYKHTFHLYYPIDTELYSVPGWINNVRVSPSGEWIAFIEHPALDDILGSVRIVDRKGNTKSSSRFWRTAKGLAWSRSGDEVWYSAGKGRRMSLQALSISGRDRTIYTAPEDFWLHDVSDNGQVLAASGDPSSTIAGVTAIRSKLSWFDWSTAADLSPDGKILLFYEWGFAVQAALNIYLQPMDGVSKPKTIGYGKPFALSNRKDWVLALQRKTPEDTGTLVRISTLVDDTKTFPRGQIKDYEYASWFPSGEHILITGIEQGQENGHRHRYSYVQDLNGAPPARVTQEEERAILIFPDEKHLVVKHPDDGKYYIHLYPQQINGPEPVLIEGIQADEEPIQFNADGTALYVRASGQFNVVVTLCDIKTGKRRNVVDVKPDAKGNIGLESGPRSISITPNGTSYVYTAWTALNKLHIFDGLK